MVSAARERGFADRGQRKVAKILIIENDPDVAGLLSIHLKRSGYATAFASDAVTALTVARKEEPDLILLDLGLPGGDGYVVMDRLKAIGSLAHVPVIVISGRSPRVSEEPALARGARAYFEKPLEIELLLAAVRSEIADPE